MSQKPVKKESALPEEKRKKGGIRPLLPLLLSAAFWCLSCLIFDVAYAYQYIILAVFTAAVFALATLFFTDISEKAKKKALQKKEEKDRIFTVDFKDADTQSDDYRVLLAEIASDRTQIENIRPDIAEQLLDIEDKAEKIIAYCAKDQQDAHGSDRFLGYFLPTLKKFTQMYVTLCQQGIEGDNISGTMREIEYAIRTMQDGFRKQLDSLFSEEALDISTDVTVLNTILKKEGLN